MKDASTFGTWVSVFCLVGYVAGRMQSPDSWPVFCKSSVALSNFLIIICFQLTFQLKVDSFRFVEIIDSRNARTHKMVPRIVSAGFVYYLEITGRGVGGLTWILWQAAAGEFMLQDDGWDRVVLLIEQDQTLTDLCSSEWSRAILDGLICCHLWFIWRGVYFWVLVFI